MLYKHLIPAAGLLSLVSAQEGVPPPPQRLTTTLSGVLPIIPTETPFTGLDTNQGAIISNGPPRPGFVGPGGTATVVSNNPVATYEAVLPPDMFDPFVGTVISGSIVGVGTPEGVQFTVNLTGLPPVAQYGPFGYHIHTQRVPANGNCTATMGHLDPYNRGELYMCDKAALETCQTGDLSGKYGTIQTEGTYSTSYVDKYLSTEPGTTSFFGGLAFVIHSMNKTRLTCANFELVGGDISTQTGGMASPTGVMPPGSTMSLEPFPGAATKLSWSVFGVAALAFVPFM